jgi:hypothetical protein
MNESALQTTYSRLALFLTWVISIDTSGSPATSCIFSLKTFCLHGSQGPFTNLSLMLKLFKSLLLPLGRIETHENILESSL